MNVLEDISDSIPYLELVLDSFLSPDGDEIFYFPKMPLVSPHLGVDRLSSSIAHDVTHM